jgi:hypothetical protein
MRKVFCMLLGFQLIVSGCSGHITAHCEGVSDEIATAPDMRENYHHILTPMADVAAECYCHVEDAAIVTVAAPAIVVFVGAVLLVALAAGGIHIPIDKN